MQHQQPDAPDALHLVAHEQQRQHPTLVVVPLGGEMTAVSVPRYSPLWYDSVEAERFYRSGCYANRRDPHVCVPRRFNACSTVNFGRPGGIALVVVASLVLTTIALGLFVHFYR